MVLANRVPRGSTTLYGRRASDRVLDHSQLRRLRVLTDFDSAADRFQPSIREGLPASYRMRADRHYVDFLVSRSAQDDVSPSGVRLLPIASLESPAVSDVPALVPLLDSVRQHGILQPLLVQRGEGILRVIAGHRRLAAAIAAGLRDVPCLVHDVDDETAERLREASNAAVEPAAVPVESSENGILQSAGDELARTLAATSGLADLIGGSLSDLSRGAIGTLLRAELWRASQLVQALQAARGDGAMVRTPVAIASLVDRVVRGFAPEQRMRHVDLTSSVDLPPAHLVIGDERLLTVGLTGAILATLHLLDGAPSCRVAVTATLTPSQQLSMVVGQEHVRPPDAWIQRAFDADWRERPGGASATVAMISLRKAARVHGGEANASASARGSRVSLTIPAGA